MATTQQQDRIHTLEQQLRLEVRECPHCSLTVQNPFLQRCPRCYGLLARLELSCTGCFHSSVCPMKAAADGAPEAFDERSRQPGSNLTEADDFP